MPKILEELEKLGHIVIMDNETQDYAITTFSHVTVISMLVKNKIPITDVQWNTKYDNVTIDFTLSPRA